MPSGIRDRDRGYKALMKRMHSAGASQSIATVGIHEAEGNQPEGDVTLADIAAFAEFGTVTEPRRSFIVDWADENEQNHKQELRKIARAIVTGEIGSIELGLERFGLRAVGEIQKRIRDGIPPELAQSTIDAKGSSTPLIDQGTLWQSIRHKVARE